MIQTEQYAMQHHKLLIEHINKQIQAKGDKISFAEFMQLALYAPGLGYYSAGAAKFGAAGDFVTAPEIGSLFAQCLAQQCAEILNTLPAKNILECGAGSGQLACDLLLSLEQQNIKLDNYYILELSADLRQRQQDKIMQRCPQYCKTLHWLDQLPSKPIDAVVIANEVLDAMPVTRFHFGNNLLQEYFVTYGENSFAEVLAPASKDLAAAFSAANIAAYISQPYNSEINLWLEHWIKSLNYCLNSGAILLCDYGFARAEYYHPQRNNGTLMCHYKHRAHSNPFINIGLQDITAHVDFTAIAEAATTCDLDISGYTNLASFLINCDISQFFAAGNIKQSQEIQTLTSPSEMGELFKMLALTKDIEFELLGFKNLDKRHCL